MKKRYMSCVLGVMTEVIFACLLVLIGFLISLL